MTMLGLPRKHLIYGAITFVSLLAAIVKITILRSTAWTFYLAVMYVTFLLWAVGLLREIQKKEAEGSEELDTGAPVALPAERRPTEDMLVSAETYLSIGESIDTICQVVEPRYRDWTRPEKLAFRQSLRAALDERQAKSAGSRGA